MTQGKKDTFLIARISSSDKKRLNQEADKQGWRLSRLVREIISRYFDGPQEEE